MTKKHLALAFAAISSFVVTPVLAGPSVKDMDIRGIKLGMAKELAQQKLPDAVPRGENELVVKEKDAYLQVRFTSSKGLKPTVKEVHFCQDFDDIKQEDAILEKVKQKYGKPDEEPQKGKLSYGITSEKQKAAQQSKGYSVKIDGVQVDFSGKDDFVFLRVATDDLRNYDVCNARPGRVGWGLYLWLRDGPTTLKDKALSLKEARLANEQKAKTDAESVKARF